jgi:hypothetical protein
MWDRPDAGLNDDHAHHPGNTGGFLAPSLPSSDAAHNHGTHDAISDGKRFSDETPPVLRRIEVHYGSHVGLTTIAGA